MEKIEIEKLVFIAKDGNKEAMLKLYQEFIGFIKKNAKKYTIRNHEQCDLEQIAYLALDKAVKSYKLGSNTFISYLCITIENQFKQALRKTDKEKDDRSLNEPVNSSIDSATEFIDSLLGTENIEEKILKAEQDKELQAALGKLNKLEKEFILSLYWENNTVASCAKAQDIHYSKAQREKNKILGNLRTSLGVCKSGKSYIN
jgi:RNA polymerase sporulation-specific sigma factor